MLGVRDVGLVFIKGILVYDKSGTGLRIDTTDPADKCREPQHSSLWTMQLQDSS